MLKWAIKYSSCQSCRLDYGHQRTIVFGRERPSLHRLYKRLGKMGGQIWSASEMAAAVVVVLNQCLYKLSEPERQNHQRGLSLLVNIDWVIRRFQNTSH